MSLHWTAQAIAPDSDFDGAPLLRRELTLDRGHGEVVQATWHVTAHGVVEAFLNGAPVSDDVLTPGWTSYEWRLRYRSHDVTPALVGRGADEQLVLGLALGNGWYRGRLSWHGNRNFYGSELAALAQLEVVFDDGHTQTVATDESWSAGPSAVLANDLYDGQTIDARLRSDAWLQPGFVGEGWTGVHPVERDPGTLTPYVGPPVRRQAELAPVRIWTSPAGRTLVDFGQNLVGWVRVEVSGEAGSEVVLRHAEVLENDELGVRPLRTAAATDRFVLSGGQDVFEPTFTFHGFRYAEVTGWPGELRPDDLTAVVVHSDLERTGHFSCSDALLNQLHANVVWGLRGNFLDVPTDCPQRDERLGWTGDLAVFTPTASYLYDVSDFLRDWYRDLAAEQRAAQGRVPFVVPDVLKMEEHPPQFPAPESAAVWSDVAVWLPWDLWRAYGDRDLLAEQYDTMTAHLRRVEGLVSASGLWDAGFQFGDWLDPTAPPDAPFKAQADSGVVATACLYRSATTTAAAAEVLGRTEDARAFQGLAERTRAAFNQHYVSDDGTVVSDCPTVYALAIVFQLLSDERRERAGNRLAGLVADNGYRIATGFAGTPYVTDALTATGHLDQAYRLLLERECPSWLYPVTMGATTVWERWDSMLPDGTINPGEMTSFNHYALGAVADWMHRVIGGLSPLEPGYATALVAPQPGGGITSASTSVDTRYGRLAVAWSLEQDVLRAELTVPAGITALVRLPGAPEQRLGAGTHLLSTAP